MIPSELSFMIIRIVKMTFIEEKVADFQLLFDEHKSLIRAFEGVQKLELLRDKTNPNIFFTYSIWEDESQLLNYRKSALFKKVWGQTKVLFKEKAEAWSVDKEISI